MNIGRKDVIIRSSGRLPEIGKSARGPILNPRSLRISVIEDLLRHGKTVEECDPKNPYSRVLLTLDNFDKDNFNTNEVKKEKKADKPVKPEQKKVEEPKKEEKVEVVKEEVKEPVAEDNKEVIEDVKSEEISEKTEEVVETAEEVKSEEKVEEPKKEEKVVTNRNNNQKNNKKNRK